MSEKAAWLRDAARPPMQNPFADSILQEQFHAEEAGGVPALSWRAVPGGSFPGQGEVPESVWFSEVKRNQPLTH